MSRKTMSVRDTAIGVGIGAGSMYFFDPICGARRRAMIRDKAVRFSHVIENAAEVVGRDTYNRLRGMGFAVTKSFHHENVDDEVLVARIRTEMGRRLSHPRALHVEVRNGRVALSGPVLTSEQEQVLRVVRKVPGVKEVDNHLSVHETPGHISSLQGGEERWRSREHWSPLERALAGGLGSVLAGLGISKGGIFGWSAAVAGTLLTARAATNLEMKKLIGISTGRRAIEIQKDIVVNADPELVFSLWSNYRTFPFFMSHVRRVEDLGNGRSRWMVDGPAGIPVEFTAKLTRRVEGRELAWETEEGSAVQHEGIVRFDPVFGGTRVHIRFFYNPPAGAVGHALAALLGSDPEKRIEEDLVRMKTSIETEKLPHDAAAHPSPQNRVH